MSPPNEEAKEIRLFGEKSVREEAYHQKILQLEKEIARLEALAKNSQHSIAQKNETSPVHLEGLYYESLISFDKKVKKEQEFLERRATEIVERLNLQAQQLISSIGFSYRQRVRWLALSGLAVIGLFILLFLAALFLYKVSMPGLYNIAAFQEMSYTNQAEIPHRRLSYIKTALQTQTVYHNQYEVNYIDLLDGIYVAEIELNFLPTDKWFLKNLSSDVVDVFQRYNSGTPAELSFHYKGKLYIKAFLTGIPQRVRFQYYF